MTSHDSSIVSGKTIQNILNKNIFDFNISTGDHTVLYNSSNNKDSSLKELLKQKIILFDNNETRL